MLIDFLKKIYRKTKITFRDVKEKLFPVSKSRRLYKERVGLKLNIKNPESLNEKMMYLKNKVYWNNPIISQCADKYAVREFIKDAGCAELLIGLLGAWDKVEDIDWDSLPKKFVLKCNHGCAMNIICNDKSKFDIEDAKAKLSKWMNMRFGYMNAEEGIYDKIPRKIIAEEFIETEDGHAPRDYKFFCSYGEVKLILICSERDNGTRISYFYPNWTNIDVRNGTHENIKDIKKPEQLNNMIKYAELLSKRFPIVRVDFYCENNIIIFGELTFTTGACMTTYNPHSYDLEFGKLFPVKEEINRRGIE